MKWTEEAGKLTFFEQILKHTHLKSTKITFFHLLALTNTLDTYSVGQGNPCLRCTYWPSHHLRNPLIRCLICNFHETRRNVNKTYINMTAAVKLLFGQKVPPVKKGIKTI